MIHSLFENHPSVFYGGIFLFFTVFGSFLNVLIHRLPRNESIAFPPSACPKCGTRLKPYHNIPIVSWLFLRGKCGFCAETISIRYPLVETATGLIGISVFFVNGLSIESVILSVIFSLLIAMSLIDYETHEISDSLNFVIFGLAALLWVPDLSKAVPVLSNLFIGAGAIAMLRIVVTHFLGEEAMGEGDIPVVAVITAILGFHATDAVLYAALLALVSYGLFKKEIPFIPFLTGGLLIAWYSKYSLILLHSF